ncbi:hypothetical protein BG011_004452 [Mortierella polycephala]|uniref:Vacuolar import/degradation Vid27 C-terminal domain-containing protein n=1 Tax=Mortierella polycephala TaxID=41804 RepID=A0A9P6U1J5_9FUNG|nr:hypothetical protein BG011_004452 [Mortierella polycephala]
MAGMLKNLGWLIWGDPAIKELSHAIAGQFHVFTPYRDRQCIYIDARMTIHEESSQPLAFQIAVECEIEEGGENLLDDQDDEMKFDIDKNMTFQRGILQGSTTFTWKRIGADNDGRVFQFVCDEETTTYFANSFEATVYHCMYQLKYRKLPSNEKDLGEFEIRSSNFETPFSSGGTPMSTCPQPSAPSGIKQSPIQSSLIPQLQHLQYDGVSEFPGDLFLFDPETATFMKQGSGQCQLIRDNRAQILYWLSVVDVKGTQLICQPIGPNMEPTFQTSNAGSRDSAMKNEVQKTRGHFYKKEDQDSDEYSDEYSENESEDGNEEETEADNKVHGGVQQNRSYDEDESEDETYHFDGHGDNSKNSQLAVGYKDRSFVLRGNKIGVFSHNDRDGLDFNTTIKNISDSRGQELHPSRVVLHEQDTAMVMMDPRNLNRAYKMDLEYGKVVEEWEMPGTSGVLNLVGSSKYAHLTSSKTMVGHSQTAMFRVDPRLSGSKIVEKEFKQYAKGNNFTCVATTDNGSVAIAGAKGDIKLLNAIGKNAKTALTGLGDSIIGIDVTANGQYVLATCKTYLLLINVLNPKNKTLGFDASFPVNEKPQPVKLHLRPEHVCTMREPVSFTPARFNTGENELEKAIVTSTGPYVITWNLRRVCLGHYEYQIKKYADNVVADNFKYGQDRSIFVTLPDDVTSLQKKNLLNAAEAFEVGR